MKHRSKLNQSQEQTEEHLQGIQEFANAKELLRFDAAQTTVPPEIESRLKESMAQSRPAKSAPWWKRLLGR